ncbi:hypothetical protein V8E53_012331 [Lactarius tabidus]
MGTTGDMPPPEGDQKHICKPRHLLADLPFPEGSGRKYLVIWWKVYVPSLICWAGAQGDLFGTNCQMDDQVMCLWERIYPSVTVEKGTSNHEIILTVCENILNNWCSDMGKAGHCVVTNFWLGDPKSFALAGGCAEYVSNMLTGLHYVYRAPDEPVGHIIGLGIHPTQVI